jgi:diguanylate cyclase (GGDEF)-like protein
MAPQEAAPRKDATEGRMAAVSRARPGNSFATRLAVAVLLASCLASALVAGMANRLAEGAVQRETVERVSAAAGAASTLSVRPRPATASGVPDPTRTPADMLAWLAAESDVLGLLVVDQHGTVLLDEAGTTAGDAAVPDASPATRAALGEVARGSAPTLATGRHRSGLDMFTVSVPIRLSGGAAALQVQLVAAPAVQRADQLWRALGVALMLGTGATVVLVFATGGRGLVRRFEGALAAAGRDDLTGLGSRRAFRRDLRLQVEHAARRDLPLTLALIDVNGLEGVNGTVGRRRGDALLLGVGSVLLRAAELVGRPVPAYRIGGDAFALIMPGTAQDDAFTLTETLCTYIGLDAAPLTANVGLGVLDPVRCPDSETLLIATDAALFEARSLGGNRVVGAGDGGTGLRWVATSGARGRRAP